MWPSELGEQADLPLVSFNVAPRRPRVLRIVAPVSGMRWLFPQD